MAAFKDYAAIAIAVYSSKARFYPSGHNVPGYSCKIWETGTWFGNGFQGWNFRLIGDPVSKFGHHVGTEVELDYVEWLGGKHGKESCMLAMAKSGWWSEDVGWYF